MAIRHVPLLGRQRALQQMPRDMARFQAYLSMVLEDDRQDVRLMPLIAANPMAREHVGERLDALLALDAEAIAAAALDEAQSRLRLDGDFEHGLVLLDDVRGGWTNRITNDFALRFGIGNVRPRPWITSGLWVSDVPSATLVRQTVLAAVFRLGWGQGHGAAETLAQRMAQEGAAAAFAGHAPELDPADRAYSREVLAPWLASTAVGVQIAALYGDEAARTLGYAPLGLSPRAGLAVALADVLGVV